MVVRYGDVVAVAEVDLVVGAGEVVALMGRNGSGKSSLLWAIQGAGPRQRGTVDVAGSDPASRRPTEPERWWGWCRRRRRTCSTWRPWPASASRPTSMPARRQGPVAPWWSASSARSTADQHPRDLSEGQRLGLVLAVQLTAGPPVVLLDEPTRGLDYGAKDRLVGVLGSWPRDGRAVVVGTHDVEFVAAVADRVVVLADGEVVADGPTAEVVVASPAFAPQVAKVLQPQPWLTPAQVAEALGLEVGP